MPQFQSDTEFKATLNSLSLEQQRVIGKQFVESVIQLSDDPKVVKSISVVGTSVPSLDELAESHKSAKSAAIDSYTLCGQDADWLRQASHFVAASAAICLTPPKMDDDDCVTLAWETAMNARMARTCEKISRGEGADESEAKTQYSILSDFLS